MDRKTDYRQWDHTCRAFDSELTLLDDLTEIESFFPEDSAIVVLDESASQSLHEFVHPENAVYIFGRTGLNRMQDMIEYDHAIHIETDVCLFGVVAAGVVLYDRKLKRGRHCNQ